MTAINSKLLRDRLILAIPSEDHINGLDHLLNDPTVENWLGGTRTREDIKKDIVTSREHWSKFGFGQWVVLDCETSEIVARGGLRRTEVLGHAEVELFYAVLPERQRQGIATALAAAAMDHAFRVSGLASIIAFTLEANLASLRVLEKLGFMFETKFEHANLPHVLFRKALKPLSS